jgi:glycosyltransferase involved in cell wall biosynthesis
MPQPVVSAVMPNYNDADTIHESLDAILSQSFKELEIIVIDDASTDNSLEVIGEIARRDSRIKVFQHERNMGPIVAQLTGLTKAVGDYLFIASANDKVLPGYIEKLINCMESHPEVGVCFSDIICMDDQNYSQIVGFSKEPVYLTPEALVNILRKRLFFVLGGGSSLIRRSMLRDAGWLIPELKWMADFFALHVVAFRHGVCYIPEPLYVIRKPSYSETGPKSSEHREAVLWMLRLLKSPEYRDVWSPFRRAGILAAIPKLLSAVLPYPEHWDFLNMVLLKRALWNETKNLVRPFTPAPLRQAYRHMRDQCFSVKKIYCGRTWSD